MTTRAWKLISFACLSVLLGTSMSAAAACQVSEQGGQKAMECDAEAMARANEASTADRQRNSRRIAPATAATLTPDVRLNGAALRISPISDEDAAALSKRATLKRASNQDNAN